MNPVTPKNAYILEEKRFQESLTFLVDVFFETYQTEDMLYHMPTIVGAAAAVTGECSLLACHVFSSIEGREYIISDAVNDFVFLSQENLSVFDLVRQNVDISNLGYSQSEDFVLDVMRRTSAQFGSSMYPALSIPDQFFPYEWSPNACVRFRSMLEEVASSYGLNSPEKAWLMALVTGELIGLSRGLEAEKLSMVPVPQDMLVLMAMEIVAGCSRMSPLTETVGE